MDQELRVQRKREADTKQESTIPARVYVPVTDIFETQDALILKMEMPGVSKDQVDVRVENDILTIEARIDFGAYDSLRPLYTEYNVGNYARTFQLSSKIEQERISASLKDGVMTLDLPKVERAKPRKIQVS